MLYTSLTLVQGGHKAEWSWSRGVLNPSCRVVRIPHFSVVWKIGERGASLGASSPLNLGSKFQDPSQKALALLKSTTLIKRGCGSSVVKVSDHGRHVMSSSPVPLKTLRAGKGGASSGVVHITTMVQNYVVRR
ncbi:hypothetical protein TNCV_2213571 [Trichonephila clavipes]|nr:hypothetical protein TNCV_2213571 [Trichonephila clavipes]